MNDGEHRATAARVGDDIVLAYAEGQPAGPVTYLEEDIGREPETGVGLCLSGGGSRAMLYHAGAVLRLLELGQLASVARISSVSGGSIFAGVLALNWSAVTEFGPKQAVHAYREHVIEPLRAFARLRIDVRQWLIGTFVPGTSPIRRLVGVLDSELYHGATLQDLPSAPPGPRFVILGH